MNLQIERNQQIELIKFNLCEQLTNDSINDEALARAIIANGSDRHLEVQPLVNWLWARLIEYRLKEAK